MTEVALPPDAELIERLRSDDQTALELLVAQYWSPLCQFAEGVLDGVADPEDVVQEVFIRLWNRRTKWDGEGSVRALLYTVTRNVALDERRRGRREEKAADVARPPSPAPTPSDDAAAAELRSAARAAVSSLPPKRQEIFRLAREEGLTYAEIASVLGLSPQTVANHMSLALADLRRALAAHLTEKTPIAR
jgi:RNA polymerase sigma-70 factor (ECF subfamily)